MEKENLIWAIEQVLPQTQCQRCGFEDCHNYAKAIAENQAEINQCPPGGKEVIFRLSNLTGKKEKDLNPKFGIEGPVTIALIDENWCIGCTLCIKACPVDAILGSNKLMHVVIGQHCTGCELCIPVCPVDCISLEIKSDKWSDSQAQNSKIRYENHKKRLNEKTEKEQKIKNDQKNKINKKTKLAEILAKAKNNKLPMTK